MPLPCRYGPELGDVVIGRVTEASTVAAPVQYSAVACQQQRCPTHFWGLQVANKRWKVSLGAKQDAALQLSAVNLPGGVQVSRPAHLLHPCRMAPTA